MQATDLETVRRRTARPGENDERPGAWELPGRSHNPLQAKLGGKPAPGPLPAVLTW